MSGKFINILKASLPFMPQPMQRGLSYYIKIEEFNTMVQNFQEDAKSSLSACSVTDGEDRNFNLNEYLAAISPYLSANEREMLQMATNIVQALKLYHITKDFSFGSTEPAPTADPATCMNLPSIPSASPEEVHADTIAPQKTNTDTPSGFNIDNLKNMLSPSQQALFETYSAMLNQ